MGSRERPRGLEVRATRVGVAFITGWFAAIIMSRLIRLTPVDYITMWAGAGAVTYCHLTAIVNTIKYGRRGN